MVKRKQENITKAPLMGSFMARNNRTGHPLKDKRAKKTFSSCHFFCRHVEKPTANSARFLGFGSGLWRIARPEVRVLVEQPNSGVVKHPETALRFASISVDGPGHCRANPRVDPTRTSEPLPTARLPILSCGETVVMLDI